MKGVYEGTIGRFTEWISSTDTPRTASPPRLSASWPASSARRRGSSFRSGRGCSSCGRARRCGARTSSASGERRAVLSVEYSVKALCASAARLVAATPPDKDTARLHAWVGGATPAVLQANGAEIVSTVGPGSFIVTLPRGDAFTRSLVGLIGGGVKVLDIAGNDEIALTAIVRQTGTGSAAVEEAPPAGRVMASDALLTEPAARRLTLRAPLARLAEMAAWLQRRGAVLERIYDY